MERHDPLTASPPARRVRCVACNYDLEGLEATAACPECGYAVVRSVALAEVAGPVAAPLRLVRRNGRRLALVLIVLGAIIMSVVMIRFEFVDGGAMLLELPPFNTTLDDLTALESAVGTSLRERGFVPATSVPEEILDETELGPSAIWFERRSGLTRMYVGTRPGQTWLEVHVAGRFLGFRTGREAFRGRLDDERAALHQWHVANIIGRDMDDIDDILKPGALSAMSADEINGGLLEVAQLRRRNRRGGDPALAFKLEQAFGLMLAEKRRRGPGG